VYEVQAVPSSFSSQRLTMTDLFVNVSSLLLRREHQVPVLRVNSTVSRSLLQEHGYRNSGGMGKLESAEELDYGACLAQLTMLR
jgi:hypothetical protein